VTRYALLEPTPAAATEVLLRYEDGAPALVERQVGDGRVLWFTTTVDRDWTDLPIRTAYLPFVRHVVDYLATRGRTSGAEAAFVGERLEVPLPARTERVEVLVPSGESLVFERNPEEVPAPLVLPSLDVGGIYAIDIRVAGRQEPIERRYVAVATDPRELDLAQVDTETIMARLTRDQGTDDTPELAAAPGAAPLQTAGGARSRYWPPVLIVLFGLLFLETWLVIRT
jgi:hypothetical protein